MAARWRNMNGGLVIPTLSITEPSNGRTPRRLVNSPGRLSPMSSPGEGGRGNSECLLYGESAVLREDHKPPCLHWRAKLL